MTVTIGGTEHFSGMTWSNLNMTVTIGGTEYYDDPFSMAIRDKRQAQLRVSNGQGAAETGLHN